MIWGYLHLLKPPYCTSHFSLGILPRSPGMISEYLGSQQPKPASDKKWLKNKTWSVQQTGQWLERWCLSGYETLTHTFLAEPSCCPHSPLPAGLLLFGHADRYVRNCTDLWSLWHVFDLELTHLSRTNPPAKGPRCVNTHLVALHRRRSMDLQMGQNSNWKSRRFPGLLPTPL